MSRTLHPRVIVGSAAVALLALIGSALTGCRRDTQAASSATVDRTVATRTVAVPVNGMICQICAGSVKSALKRGDGVQDAEISLKKRNAVIHYDERKVSVERLTRATHDAGFKPGVPTALQ